MISLGRVAEHLNMITPNVHAVSKQRAYLTTLLLFGVNLVNYMDRYTIPANIIDIQDYFKINDSEAGLIQVVFVIVYMIFAPIFGYLGDRYSRKVVISIGIFIWLAMVMASTFMQEFWSFLLCRAIVGIGEASYSTIAPTLIADLFKGDMRSKMLMLFYFATPVGTGLGYVIGGSVAQAFNDWRWGLRATPMIGAVLLIIIVLYLQDPPRGANEAVDHEVKNQSNFIQDIKYIFSIKSFWGITIGQTAVAFGTGALAFWIPGYIQWAYQSLGDDESKSSITFIFGIIVTVGGLVGVAFGSYLAQFWRRYDQSADALTCALSLMINGPLSLIGIILPRYSINASYAVVFFAVTSVSMNWAVTTDILMYVVTPSRRSIANAALILISHLFGDATSPYLIGLISDSIRVDDNAISHYNSLQSSMFMMCFVAVLGGGGYLFTALFVVKDRKRQTLLVQGGRVQPLATITNANSVTSNESIVEFSNGTVNMDIDTSAIKF